MSHKYQNYRNSREIMFHIICNIEQLQQESDSETSNNNWIINDIIESLNIVDYNQELLEELQQSYQNHAQDILYGMQKYQHKYFIKGITKFIIYSALNEYLSTEPNKDKQLIIKEYLILADKYSPQGSKIIHAFLDEVCK